MTLVIILKAGVEVALMLMLARSLVFAVSFGQHANNPIHRLLSVATAPIDRFARLITPGPVLNRHLPVVSFLMLLWCWVGLVWLKAWLIGEGA